jgi:putative toxin-antitoxin system antitoxin component (TIGR02293 family)
MMAQNVAERLGGRPVLKREVRSDLEMSEMIQAGISVRALEHVLEWGDLEPSEAYDLVGSRRTLMRKKRDGRDLSPSESDRLARIVRMIGRAEEALGDRGKAHTWLRNPNRGLAGRRPLDLLGDDAGVRLVERILGRIEHGVYS